MRSTILCLALPVAASLLPIASVAAPEPAPAAGPAASAGSAAGLTDGVVETVDAGGGIVTLRHGEIANMRMPAMTMTFGVADKAMLVSIKPGDRVRFRVEMLANAPTITRIEAGR